MALLWAETGKPERAAELAGLVVNHPATEIDTAQAADTVLTRLRAVLSSGMEAALEPGMALELDAVVADVNLTKPQKSL